MTPPSGGGWGPVWVSAVSCSVVALTGGLLTPIDAWYKGLKKPSWQPPDWLFGPAWTVIFIGIGTSAVQGWTHAPTPWLQTLLIILFALNGALNVAWSFLFFYRRRPDWALREVVALWLSILLLILVVGAVSPLGALLLLPYLAWVGFAAYLNRTIVRLNGSFA